MGGRSGNELAAGIERGETESRARYVTLLFLKQKVVARSGSIRGGKPLPSAIPGRSMPLFSSCASRTLRSSLTQVVTFRPVA